MFKPSIQLLIFLLHLTFHQNVALAEPDHILFHLKRGGTQCFTITARANANLRGEVRVANANGELKIGFWLLVAATNQVLLSKQHVSFEKFTVRAPPGSHHGHDSLSAPAEYKLCAFQRETPRADTDTTAEPRKVYLTFDAGPDPDAFSERNGVRDRLNHLARQESVDSMKEAIAIIESTITEVTEEIDSIRDREQSMFAASNAVAKQIWILGLVSCATIVMGGLLQSGQTKTELQKRGVAPGSRDAFSKDGTKRMSRHGSLQMPSGLGRLQSSSTRQEALLPSHEQFSRAQSLQSPRTAFSREGSSDVLTRRK